MNSPFALSKLSELGLGTSQLKGIQEQPRQLRQVAVTGANGFVGSNLTKHMIESGCRVQAIVRPNRRLPAEIELDASKLTYCDVGLESIDRLAKSFEGCDTVIHVAGATAGRTYRDYLETNLRGTRHVLEAACRMPNRPRVVLISSLAAAGPSDRQHRVTPDEPPHPVSWYGRSKYAAERIACRYAAELPLTIIRPSIVFGPSDRAVLALMQTIAKSHVNPIAGYHIPKMSFVHIQDLVEAIALAAVFGKRVRPGQTKPYGQGIYFVGDPETCSFTRFGAWAAKAMGTSWHIPLPIPLWIVGSVAWVNQHLSSGAGVQVLTIDKVREASAAGWECDVSNTMADLNWAPKASLEERIQQTVQWYRQNHWL